MEDNYVYNRTLNDFMRYIRRKRPRLLRSETYVSRYEKTTRGSSAFIWFLTNGCSWDQEGGCTMCNHGLGHKIDSEEMVYSIQKALAQLPKDIKELFISPSGSMLDEKEVPKSVLQVIYEEIDKLNLDFFAFETRAETITYENIEKLSKIKNIKQIGVEIGLESADPWILKYCINKGNRIEDFINALKILSSLNILCMANVSLGSAFLSEREAIEDAVSTVHWAIDNGADEAVVFPMHIKPYTLLAWLSENDLYAPPSLWSLVEVIYRVGKEYQEKVDISWYRNLYTDKSKIISSPTTCPKCEGRLLELLDEYRIDRDYQKILQMRELKCECKDIWIKKLELEPELTLNERVDMVYAKLTEKIRGDQSEINITI